MDADTVKPLISTGGSSHFPVAPLRFPLCPASGAGGFDAVVLDRHMEGSGDEVLRWIRRQANLRDVCVVMLTAHGDVESAVQSLKNGAFQYLEKPVTDTGQLRSVLAAGIAWQKSHAVRRSLLTSFDRHELLSRIRGVLADALQPNRPHIVFSQEVHIRADTIALQPACSRAACSWHLRCPAW